MKIYQNIQTGFFYGVIGKAKETPMMTVVEAVFEADRFYKYDFDKWGCEFLGEAETLEEFKDKCPEYFI